MEIVIAVFEIMLDLFCELIYDKNIPKWLRLSLFIILSIIYLAIVVLLGYIAIKLVTKDNKPLFGLLLGIINAFLLLVYVFLIKKISRD